MACFASVLIGLILHIQAIGLRAQRAVQTRRDGTVKTERESVLLHYVLLYRLCVYVGHARERHAPMLCVTIACV